MLRGSKTLLIFEKKLGFEIEDKKLKILGIGLANLYLRGDYSELAFPDV